MARGDTVAGLSSINTNGTLSIRPGEGIEWIIHNIYNEAEVELYLTDSAGDLLFDNASSKGSWSAYFFHLTNTHYLKVKNTNAGTKLIGYDGIVNKE